MKHFLGKRGKDGWRYEGETDVLSKSCEDEEKKTLVSKNKIICQSKKFVEVRIGIVEFQTNGKSRNY